MVSQLVEELKTPRESGQPLILEDHRHDANGPLRVYVIWDRFENVSDDQRTETILRAYETFDSDYSRDRFGLVTGLTVEEAADVGLLPFQVIPMRKRDDRLSIEDCREAIAKLGASAGDIDRMKLRFHTVEEAQTAMDALRTILPGSQ